MSTVIAGDDHRLFPVSVTSDGRPVEEVIKYLDRDKEVHYVTVAARRLMLNDRIKVTKGITYNLAVIKGKEFSGCYSSDEYLVEKIRKEADRRGYKQPPAEVAHLIFEKITREYFTSNGLMGLIIMNKPIKINSPLSSGLFAIVDPHDKARPQQIWLDDSFFCNMREGWPHKWGFVFLK
jgi:hypothetical protein